MMSVAVDIECPIHGQKAVKRPPSLFSLLIPSGTPSLTGLTSLPSSAFSLLDCMRDFHSTVSLDTPAGLSPLSLKRTLSTASSARVSLPALYAACLVLFVLTSLSVSSHFFLSSSAALPLSLSFTTVPSLPHLHLDHLHHTVSPLPYPTRNRLTPVRVEESERQAGLVLNPYILSGYAHLPPLFSALPCIIPYKPTVVTSFSSSSEPAVDPFASCVSERLLLGNHDVYTAIVSTYEEGSVRAVQQQLYHNALTSGHMAAMRDTARQTKVVDEFVAACTTASPPCTLSTAASHLYSLASSTISRYWISDLQVGHVYTFAVQYFNGSHLTAPFVSQPTRIFPQQQHYNREKDKTSHYLESLFPPTPTTTTTTSSRRLAPFEAADSVCPTAFHKFVDEYRQWHVEQVARLLEVRDDPAALFTMLSASTSPPRLLVSVANPNSGLSDRTHGLLGVYMVALLTRRVLLLADEWTDILYSMQPSLSLRASTIAPHLNHSLLAGLLHTVPYSFEGMPIDALNSVFPSPVTSITSIRGMLLRFLHLSKDYSSQLKDMGLTSDNIVGCVYHSLWTVRLSTLTSYEGYEAGYSTLLREDVRGVGVQIRTWNDQAFADLNEAGTKQQEEQRGRDRAEEERLKRDDPAFLAARERKRAEEARRLARTARQAQIKTLTTNGVYGYFHCAADVSDSMRQDAAGEDEPVYPVWLLMADDERLRSAAVARWGRAAADPSKPPPATSLSLLSSTASAAATSPASQAPPPALITFTVPQLLGHSSLGDYESQLLYQQHAIVEQTLFSLCTAHVISRYSGFGRLPAVLGMRGRRVYGVSHVEADRERGVCMDEEMYGMTMEELASENSWL